MAEDAVALVTGGGRGIGLAAAQRLLRDGFRVAVIEVNEKALDAARAATGEDQGRFLPLVGSVVDSDGMSAAVARIAQQWGRLDVLVNNAAVNRPGGLSTQAESDWDAVINVNLKGPFIASRAVAEVMKAQGSGSIVNVGSIGAAGLGASPAYAASKAGLIGLTKQMAYELGPSGIRVNLVAPGVTTTDWVERNLGPERIQSAEQSAPLRRVGTPDDIAAVIAFLASADSRHITGQVISASGGAWMP
jgi:3-oxoacyl-[acyl-carrier protein] reductase